MGHGPLPTSPYREATNTQGHLFKHILEALNHFIVESFYFFVVKDYTSGSVFSSSSLRGRPGWGFAYFCAMMKRFGFGKKEKLKSRKQIEDLFVNGKSFAVFPIRVTYQFLPSNETGLQAGVTASKRNFKKAVDRNRIKRLLREAYRLQKNDLSETLKRNKKKGFLFFMYTDKTIASFDIIKQAMNKCLKQLEKLVEVNESFS